MDQYCYELKTETTFVCFDFYHPFWYTQLRARAKAPLGNSETISLLKKKESIEKQILLEKTKTPLK